MEAETGPSRSKWRPQNKNRTRETDASGSLPGVQRQQLTANAAEPEQQQQRQERPRRSRQGRGTGRKPSGQADSGNPSEQNGHLGNARQPQTRPRRRQPQKVMGEGTTQTTQNNASNGINSSIPSGTTSKRKTMFAEYIDAESLLKGVRLAELFRGTLRVNANDKTQGFLTIPGLPTDVFIRGYKAQNRAVEGDEVVVRILPVAEWHARSSSQSQPTSSIPPRQPSGTVMPLPPLPAALEEVPSSSRQVSPFASSSPPVEGNILPCKLSSMREGSRNQERLRELTPPAWAAGESSTLLNDDIVAMPLLQPSPSGGELAVALVKEPLGADFQGEDGMVAFIASQMEGVKLQKKAQPIATAAVDDILVSDTLPWQGCSSPEDALAVISDLLNGDFDGWRATAEVVGILTPSARRSNLVGVLRFDGQGLFLLPCDPRMPRALVYQRAVPKNMTRQEWEALLEEARQAHLPRRTLIAGGLRDWSDCKPFPTATISRILGKAGELQVEVESLLAMERVKDDDQFDAAILACLPPLPWSVSESDVVHRRDFRNQRVFSIDPPTARDLDDALSVELLENGLLRIAVHIADVSHFVLPKTALDAEAAERATSVYLVDRVIPMLPRPLCEDLCSLNPGVDRLCMSVVWDMTKKGDIVSTWMGRSVIRSCAKLSYPQVQALIDAESLPTADQEPPEDVTLFNGHAWADVAADAMRLHGVAQELRRQRFEENGALRLDNTRLYFTIDGDGNPDGYGIYEQKEANRLVEEFMLKANMSAAEFISSVFPSRALLRRHPAPNEVKMKEIAAMLARLLPDAPEMDVSSAGAVHASLMAIREAMVADVCLAGNASKCIMEVVTMLCTKPMQLAKYFCTGDVPDPSYWRHYALAVGHYTHFTSPIRRYADIIVHRLIAAALELQQRRVVEGCGGVDIECQAKTPEDADSADVELSPLEADVVGRHGLLDTDAVSEVANHCNERKLAAKAAQDGALRLYLAAYLLEQPGVYLGIVAGLGGHRFFDVYVPALGVDVRVYTADALQGGENAVMASWSTKDRILTLARAGTALPDAVRARYDDVTSFDKLRNADGIAPIALPMEVRPLCTVPLVVGARTSKSSGSPAGVHAKLWLS